MKVPKIAVKVSRVTGEHTKAYYNLNPLQPQAIIISTCRTGRVMIEE